MVINIMKKHLFRPILIACDAIIARVQDSAGRCVWPDLCLEPGMHARCHVCRVGQRCPASVTLPWCGNSGVNAAFCTLFNGSGKALPEVLAVVDAISPPMVSLRVDHGQRRGVRHR